MKEQEGSVFFEIVPAGNVVKATAIDAATGTEASIVAPRNTPLFSLKANAKRKLQYIMEKEKNKKNDEQ